MTPAGAFSLYNTSTTNVGPVGIAAGPDGNVWYTKQQGVGLATPGGQITERGVPGGRDSAGIAAGPDGNLWFTEPNGNRIAKVTPAGMFTELTVPTTASGPFGITTGPDGNIWFTEQTPAANKIGRVTPAGMFTEWPIPTAASSPYGIIKGPDGNVWFTEQDGHKIGRITPTGTVTEFPVPSGGNPGAITAGPDGNLWFAETGAVNAIGRITPAGTIAEYQVPTPNAEVQGICLGPDGNIYFTELSTNKVGRISNLTGGGTVKPGVTMAPPMGKACTSDHDCIAGGMACGGDVCSATTHTCVGSATMDPGTCATAANCWCMGEGATCDATTHQCSLTMFGGPSPLPDAGM
jgi:streptogramin lyase